MFSTLLSLAQAGLFALDPETAHEVSLKALEAGLYPRQTEPDGQRLAQTIWGLSFPNPIGIAAGYDKDARVPEALLAMGLGFAEAGTVTPLPQPGNPRPRVFRLINNRAVINRLGFNSEGHGAARTRLQKRARGGVIGVNIGANKDSADPIADYVAGLRAFAGAADYFTVNISSPNTPGLRGLQAPERLDELLSRLMTARAESTAAGKPWRPILVKLAPDIADDDLPPIIGQLLAHKADGAILTNTTLARNGVSYAAHRGEAGGLSGRPLFERSTRMLAKVYLLTQGKLPLIGVGGIDSPETALDKIRAGASLIQLYTGLIYEGPGLIGRIKRGLIEHVQRQGFASISQAVGLDAKIWSAAILER